MTNLINKSLSAASAAAKMAIGALSYARSRSTPTYAYQSMIRLFTLTGGRSNDIISSWIAKFNPPYRLPSTTGALGNLSPPEITRIAGGLRERGFHVFDHRLAPETCRALLDFALTRPCLARQTDNKPELRSSPQRYNRANPTSIIFDFPADDLINNATVQSLMCDSSIISIAQAYLGSRPVLDTVNLWWTTAYGTAPDSNAAQFYHFDMDHLKWIKFFVYLTDVTPQSGPHCFVAGSHRTDGIPNSLLHKGYARHTDEDVKAHYPADCLVEIPGPTGTILAEDTRGLHKGKPVHIGDRLIFELEFSNCLFGGKGLSTARLRNFHSAQFKNAVRDYGRMYERWNPVNRP